MNDDNDNVVYLDGLTHLDIPPERVLKQALKEDWEGVVVIGYDKKEGNFTFRSSIADCAEVLWLLKLVEKRLLED